VTIPQPGIYDATIAAALIGAAGATYADADAMKSWAESVGCPQCELIRDLATDTLAFVAAGPDLVVVAFRGTADLRNWITDLDCRRVSADPSYPSSASYPGEVHEGFSRAFDSILPQLRESLTRLAAGKSHIFFTGHSLGGALAMLALAWWETGIALPSADGWLYTFGQPRVGNPAWARWFDSRWRDRAFRVVHAEDIVPRVPWLLRSFRHAGHEIFFPSATWIYGITPWREDLPWWAKVPSDVFGTWREWTAQGRVAQLADHSWLQYQALFPSTPSNASTPSNPSYNL
jgi:triacylglycerol lipase